jgi:photosystem II stability/assembly factor-like uncharacterized protein
MADKTVLFAGTDKGGFILTSDSSRRMWEVSGPFLRGYSIFHMTPDLRDGSIYMVANHAVYGSGVVRSDDFGETWTPSDAEPRFEPDSDRSLKQLWHVRPGRPSEPGVIYVGAEPASLWRSEDSGKTWAENEHLQEHPSQPNWVPGAGGLCLHTIILDPSNDDRMSVGISAAGYFRTDDAGQSWNRKHEGLPRGVNEPSAEELELFESMGLEYDPAEDNCIHKVSMDAVDPAAQYMQHHGGVFRTRNFGDSWEDIGEGLPETFGFPIVSHPSRPGTIWVIPNQSGEFRASSSGAFRVFKSEDAGDSWRAVTDGLPQVAAYLTTLRESMAVDGAEPLGVYVGTKAGTLFGSRDEGES